MIDLHIHTTASDGKLSPQEVVALALKKGLGAIAITDHDTISGIAPAIEYAKGKGIEIVPGIEINCDEEGLGFKEFEVVGLFVDNKNKKLNEFTRKAEQDRLEQKKKILEKLQGLGFDLSFEELKAMAKGSLGRPHIAMLLAKKYPSKIHSIREAFEKYLGVGKPAYADRESKPGVKEAIAAIKNAGGTTFLAHPGIYPKKKAVRLIEFFQKSGGEGIETYYPYHLICPQFKIGEEKNLEIIRFFQKIAEEKGLLESGGSDFHGGDRQTMLSVRIPDSVLEKLKEARKATHPEKHGGEA